MPRDAACSAVLCAAEKDRVLSGKWHCVSENGGCVASKSGGERQQTLDVGTPTMSFNFPSCTREVKVCQPTQSVCMPAPALMDLKCWQLRFLWTPFRLVHSWYLEELPNSGHCKRSCGTGAQAQDHATFHVLHRLRRTFHGRTL